MVYPNGGGVEMERGGENAKTEESERGGAGSHGWSSPQRGQETRQPTERRKGGLVKSRKKTIAVRLNARQPRPGRRKKV
jgi:hypothetical protein